MGRIHNLLACGIALFAAMPATVQGQYANGYLMSRYRSYNEEMPLLSSTNNGFGTARSIAMGGAYTSLGADLSSIGINPAGLGMYQSSEFGITGNLGISQYSNSSPMLTSGKGDNKTSFALNNVGLALNFYEGLGDVTSFTFGFSYNRIADYNYKNSLTTDFDHLSLGEVFALQLWGIPSEWMKRNSNPSPWNNLDIRIEEWGAALGYMTGLVGAFAEPEDPNWKDRPSDLGFDNKFEELRNRTYYIRGVNLWGNDNRTALVKHNLRTESKGGAGEYNIAGGFNLRGNVYLGFSLGLQDIYRKQTVMYSETYMNNGGANDPADRMSYSQHTRVSGSGFNFKIGAIANPVGGLRIGLAFHSPTWNTINKRYFANMQTATSAMVYAQGTDTYEFEYKYSSFGRLLTGLSYTFGTKAILSVDYECDFYNWMRIRVPDSERYYTIDGEYHDEFEELKESVKDTYKPRHVIRVGGEYKITPAFAVRAGFAYHGSFLQNEDDIFNEPLPYKTMNISGGLGYRFSNRISLDLAYVFMKTDYTRYELFYYDGPNNYVDGRTIIDYGIDNAIKSNLKNHNIVMSFNVRF